MYNNNKTRRRRRRKEVHKRLPKSQVDVLNYEALVNKVLMKLINLRGNWVNQHRESLKQEGFIGLLKAKKAYNPKRGTFVTIAYLRIYTEMSHYLNKKSIGFSRENHLEDLCYKDQSSSGESVVWEDLFPGNDIDYYTIASLAIKEDDEDTWRLFNYLCHGLRDFSMMFRLKCTKEELQERILVLRSNMVSVVRELEGRGKSD